MLKTTPPSGGRYTFGIVGHPLGHSLSPALHSWIYEKTGLNAAYLTFPTLPGDLPGFISKVRNDPIHGLSVTIPHKQTVLDLVDGLDRLAEKIGAANTLYWKEGRLIGANTDVEGFVFPLKNRKFIPDAALVLGAGGAARAVLAGIRQISPACDIFIAARNQQKAAGLASDFTATPIAWEKRASVKASLIVNTTPMGMAGGDGETESPLDLSGLEAILPADGSGLVYDLVYRPLATPFLQTARRLSCSVQDGLDMLIAQGIAQIRLWTGLENLPLPAEARKMILSNRLIE